MSDDRVEQNRQREENKNSLPFGCSSKILVCMAFVALCCAAVVIVLMWDKISPNDLPDTIIQSTTAKEEISEKISGTSVQEKNILNTGSGIIYISDTSILQIDYNGNKQFSNQHSYTSPFIKGSGNYCIAYGVGSDKYRVISPSAEIYDGSQGNSITDCDINSKGTYCVLSDHTGYLSVLSAYDKDSNFIFSYSFNNYYGISCSVSENGTMAAVGAVNTVDGGLMSKVYLLDFNSDEPLATYEYKDQIIYEVDFISDNKFAVVTDELVSVVDCSTQKEVPYSYEGGFLTSYDISYDNSIVLSLSRSDDGRNCTVVTLDSSGREIGNFSTDLKIFSIDVKKDKLAMLSEDKLYMFNAYGDAFGNWQVGHDAKSVVLVQEKTAYILGVSELRKIILD